VVEIKREVEEVEAITIAGKRNRKNSVVRLAKITKTAMVGMKTKGISTLVPGEGRGDEEERRQKVKKERTKTLKFQQHVLL